MNDVSIGQNITGRLLFPITVVYILRSISRIAIITKDFGGNAAMILAALLVAPVFYGIFMRINWKTVKAREFGVLFAIFAISESGGYLTECGYKGQLRHVLEGFKKARKNDPREITATKPVTIKHPPKKHQ